MDFASSIIKKWFQYALDKQMEEHTKHFKIACDAIINDVDFSKQTLSETIKFIKENTKPGLDKDLIVDELVKINRNNELQQEMEF